MTNTGKQGTNTLLLYLNHRMILDALDDADRGRLISALLDYVESGSVPAFTGELKTSFLVLRCDVDRSVRLWQETCSRRSAAGKKSAALRAAKKAGQEDFCEEVSCNDEFQGPTCPEDAEAPAAPQDPEAAPEGQEEPAESNAAASCSAFLRPQAGAGKPHHRAAVLNRVEQCSAPSASSTNQNQNKNKNQNQNQNQNKNKNQNQHTPPCSPPRGDVRGFERFWQAYPRKVGKEAARKAFTRAGVPLNTLLEALERQREDPLWQQEGGRYIPYPATWLNQARWEDEPPAVPSPGYQRHGDPLSPQMAALVRQSIAAMDE